ISYLIAWLLEGWTYRAAAGFISVSARYFDELKSRYSWFEEKPQATIRFGASRLDQQVSTTVKTSDGNLPAKKPETIHFIYTGAAGPIMPKALNGFFDGLSHYRHLHPEKAARFHFGFLG